ncbi:hypothetical protein [Gottfriedia acidiceleris]|uniref:hypothetical protein n=1 Tax=Gottfriedia acidiceleris TaxID=371036 RepID=UPI002FFFB524
MSSSFKDFEQIKEEIQEILANIPNNESVNINFFHINIKHLRLQVEQRAEGGGQINKNVGMNANQGGQIAKNHSQTANTKSQFADGNGRSGIAGKDNDELGGQQGIKIRDSGVLESIIKTASEHVEGTENEESNTEE